jgi:hypothetical protein
MMPSPRPGSTRQAQARLEFGLGTVARANLAVVIWWWRYELLAAASLAAAWITLGIGTAAIITGGLLIVLAATASLPTGRRFLTARAWCVVTQHRVRVGCRQAWIHSRDGKIPAVLLTRCYPFGERVYLWCRAGTSAEDLSSARGLLAAACWADDIRVSRHHRYAHLVALDVTRRTDVDASARLGQPGLDEGGMHRWPSSPYDIER